MKANATNISEIIKFTDNTYKERVGIES